VSKLDQIEIALRDCKFQRAQDMISQMKDAVFETINLGKHSVELYPLLSNVINQTNTLIESYKLADKSVFSQIS